MLQYRSSTALFHGSSAILSWHPTVTGVVAGLHGGLHSIGHGYLACESRSAGRELPLPPRPGSQASQDRTMGNPYRPVCPGRAHSLCLPTRFARAVARMKSEREPLRMETAARVRVVLLPPISPPLVPGTPRPADLHSRSREHGTMKVDATPAWIRTVAAYAASPPTPGPRCDPRRVPPLRGARRPPLPGLRQDRALRCRPHFHRSGTAHQNQSWEDRL